MSEDLITGTDWTDEQNDLIVADYFDMLKIEAADGKVNKADRNRELQRLTGRNRSSIERKRMNISAVLIAMKLPRVDGFAPNDRYQSSLVNAVERYLDRNPVFAYGKVADVQGLKETPFVQEVDPPEMGEKAPPLDRKLERIARKYNHAERDFQNRSLGEFGEKIVWLSERKKLREAGLNELAKKVEWTARKKGDGVGYDIRSFNLAGQTRFLEVKTTRGGPKTPFFVTPTELAVSEERPEHWRLVRLFDVDKHVSQFRLRAPLRDSVHLEVDGWKASFG